MWKYQSFWKRFFAGLVDVCVFIPITLLSPYLGSPHRGVLIVIIWTIINHTIYWLYSVLFHARFGQTLGKMVARVKVLDVSEERIPTLRQAFIRDIGDVVFQVILTVYIIHLVVAGRYAKDEEFTGAPGQIVMWFCWGWFMLEIISMMTNKKRRAFHDYIAGTVVVRT